MKPSKQISVFIFLLLILIACIGGNREEANAQQPSDNTTSKFAILPIEITESVIEGELTLHTQDLELLGVKSKQGQILPVAGITEENTVKMGFISLNPINGEIVELVFNVTGDNPKASVTSSKGTLPSKERNAITITTKPLQQVNNDPLENYDLQALIKQALASTNNLTTQQNDSTNITLKTDFANYPLGDIDQNKQIGFEDALAALLFHYGISKDDPTDYQLYHADIDCSGKVDFEDVIDLLLRLYDLRTLTLHVCPKILQLDKDESGTVLVGGPIQDVTTKRIPKNLSIEIEETSSSTTIGKTYEVTEQDKSEGMITFESNNAGKEQVKVNIDANTFILEPGGSVTGIDGIVIEDLGGTLKESVTIKLEKLPSPPSIPFPSYPRIGKVLTPFYKITSNKEIRADFGISIPIDQSVFDNLKDHETIAEAGLVPDHYIFDLETESGFYWSLAHGKYNSNTERYSSRLFVLPSGSYIFTLVLEKGVVVSSFSEPSLAIQQTPSFEISCFLDDLEVLCTKDSINKRRLLVEHEIGKFTAKPLEFLHPLIAEVALYHFSKEREESKVCNSLPSGEFIGGGGFYQIERKRIIICLPKEESRITSATQTLRHEIFHAIQNSYEERFSWELKELNDNEWFREGTATAAMNSDASNMRRTTGRFNLHKVSTSLFDNSGFSEYETQDFWVYMGNRNPSKLGVLKDFLARGPTPLQVNETFDSKFSSFYWEWARNQIYEHSADIGDKVLGDSCSLKTAAVDDLMERNYDPFNNLLTKGNNTTNHSPVRVSAIEKLSSRVIKLILPHYPNFLYLPIVRINGVPSGGSDPPIRVKFYKEGSSDCSSSKHENIEYKLGKGEFNKETILYILISNTDFRNDFNGNIELEVSCSATPPNSQGLLTQQQDNEQEGCFSSIIANDDGATTDQNKPVTIDVLANDTLLKLPINPSTVIVKITNQPTNGSTFVDLNNTITYTPNSGYISEIENPDVFTYIATDLATELLSNEANVFVTVLGFCDSNPDSSCNTLQADFTITPPEGTVKTVFIFNAHPSDNGDNPISSYDWSFGDGTTSTGKKAEHQYLTEGKYEIILTIKDDNSTEDSVSKTVTVNSEVSLVDKIEVVQSISGHGGSIEALAYSPKGSILASGSLDDTIKLWKASNGNLIRTLRGYGKVGSVCSIAFHPKGDVIAVGSCYAPVKLWRVSDASLIRFVTEYSELANSIAFNPSGTILAHGSGANIRFWDANGTNLIRTISGHGSDVRSVTFSPNGEVLVSGSSDGTVKMWNVSDSNLIYTFSEHGSFVSSVTFSPNGEMLAFGRHDDTIEVWDVNDRSLVYTLSGHFGEIRSVAFSPDGSILASGSGFIGHDVKLWKTDDGSLIHTLSDHGEANIKSLAFSPDGRYLAIGKVYGPITVYGAKDGSVIFNSLLLE